MQEFKNIDSVEVHNSEKQNFRKIQPKEGMTLEVANAFWDKEIANVNFHNKITDVYTDDNGKEYRHGDSLLPNNEYVYNGYSYKTDIKGRINLCEGKLTLASEEYIREHKDSLEIVGKGDEHPGDERGHLIGHQFGGGDNLENLIPMSFKLNHGDFRRMENEWVDALEDGAEVYVRVEPVYEKTSNRPKEFRVMYTIDGDITERVFKNIGDDKYDAK